jgi:hypothetical protein
MLAVALKFIRASLGKYLDRGVGSRETASSDEKPSPKKMIL